jgi:2-methylaconitate cis-trans-isomerase PrpF
MGAGMGVDVAGAAGEGSGRSAGSGSAVRGTATDGCPAVVRIAHPKGLVEATVELDEEGRGVRAVGVVRTARRLLAGTAFVPVAGKRR